MARKRTIDLNADVGEARDTAGVEVEHALLGLVTTVHIACGGHTGDEASMADTVAAALEHSVRVGAHPSYPDGEGFGRRPMEIDRGELRSSLNEQLRALDRVCRTAGTAFESVKAHGALYAEVAKGGAIYETLRDVVREGWGEGPMLVLPSGCRAVAMALRDGVPACEEGFCDRAYRGDGSLVERGTRRRGAHRSQGGGGAGAQPRPRGGGGHRRQRPDPLGGHAVRALRLSGCRGHDHCGPSGDGGFGHRRGRAGACMTCSVPVGEVRRLGDRALLIGADGPEAARSLARALGAALGDGGGGGVIHGGALEFVCGFATVAVLVTDPAVDLEPLYEAAQRVVAGIGGHEDAGKKRAGSSPSPASSTGPTWRWSPQRRDAPSAWWWRT